MALPKATIGDDFGKTCTLKRGGVAIAIDSGATVRVALVTTDQKQRMTSMVSITGTDEGNDWANGVVRAVLPAASQNTVETETTTVKNIVSGMAKLEVEVNDSTQSPGNRLNTWFETVYIEDAAIS